VLAEISMSTQITFKEFKLRPEFYQQEVENISHENFNVLWIDDYYDGMLSGVLEIEDQKFRVEIITDYTQNIYPRIFAIIYLTNKEVEEEIYWNELFKKYVGNHNDLTSKDNNFLLPQSEWHFFYDQYQNRPNKGYNQNKVRGWFSE